MIRGAVLSEPLVYLRGGHGSRGSLADCHASWGARNGFADFPPLSARRTGRVRHICRKGGLREKF